MKKSLFVAAGLALAVPGAAGAQYDVPKPVTIKMVLKGKNNPVFSGPKTVEKGAELTFVSTTNPKKIGPHTVTLVKKGLVPNTKAEAKACGEELAGVCGRIARAHKLDFQTGKVNKPSVDAGKKGWDRSFGKKGDSWYTETKGEETTRAVTAKAGSTLTFFCVIHPNMVKKLKVK